MEINIIYVPLFFLFMATVLCFIGIFLFTLNQNYYSVYDKKTVGRIISTKIVGDKNNPTTYAEYPVYSFIANGDKKIESELPVKLTSQPLLDVPVWLYYTSANPYNFITEEEVLKSKRISQVIVMVSGLCAILAIFMFIFFIYFK